MSKRADTQKIEKLLAKSKQITPDQFLALKKESQKAKKPLIQYLTEKGVINSIDALKIKGELADIPFIDLAPKKIPKNILFTIPEQLAKKYQVVVFGKKRNGKLKIAMKNPEDFLTIELLQKRIGRELIPHIANPEDISNAISQYSGLETEVEQQMTEVTGDYSMPEASELKGALSPGEAIREDSPIAKIVTSMIERAIRERASDIHIEPLDKSIIVRYRIDGVLIKKLMLRKTILPAIVSRIKILSNLKIEETRLPQDGRFGLSVGGKDYDFRVSTLPIITGEKVVLRILASNTSAANVTFEQLGLVGKPLELIAKGITKPHGMILVCGPTGSGKSTTLYGALGRLNQEGVNIITLEDPVEYHIPGINQSQINPDIGFTFANGLRTILRQDPDVVMIGEIRDTETAEMAVHAALTGHIVLSTLHTNSAAGAIPRLIDMKVEPFLVASALNTIVSQRLVRKICNNCKESYAPPVGIVKEIKQEIAHLPEYIRKTSRFINPLKLFKGMGCTQCSNTGFKGRIGIFEVIDVSDKIEEYITGKVSKSDIEKVALANGMITMKQDGLLKVLHGITTMEEVWRVTEE